MTGTVISIFCCWMLSPEIYLNSFQNILLCLSSDLSLVTKLITPNTDQSLPASLSTLGASDTELEVQAQYFPGYRRDSNPWQYGCSFPRIDAPPYPLPDTAEERCREPAHTHCSHCWGCCWGPDSQRQCPANLERRSSSWPPDMRSISRFSSLGFYPTSNVSILQLIILFPMQAIYSVKLGRKIM